MAQPNKDEVEVLKLARILSDLTKTEAWKEFSKVLEEQIRMREVRIMSPIHDVGFGGGLSDPGIVTDFFGKAAAMESIKGAVIGLRLALDLPSATMAHADEIRRRYAADDQEGST